MKRLLIATHNKGKLNEIKKGLDQKQSEIFKKLIEIAKKNFGNNDRELEKAKEPIRQLLRRLNVLASQERIQEYLDLIAKVNEKPGELEQILAPPAAQMEYSKSVGK